MSRALIIIRSKADRALLARWAESAPFGTRVEFKAQRRSSEANAKMWAMLTDIACQKEWFGKKRTPEDWKDLLTAAFRECEVVPGINPGTVVPLGMRTSEMSVGEMAAFIESIAAWGAQNDVVFHDEQAEAAE